MALLTSTPKSYKHTEKEPLLDFDVSDEDNSSGYDSPVYNENLQENKVKSSKKQVFDYSSDDSDSSSDETDNELDYSDDSGDDLDDLDDIQSSDESMKVTSTKSLVENIRYILSMPTLCDVTFLVGPHRIPVHGLKSILGTRSRVFFKMFLNQSKEELKKKKKSKKSQENQIGNANTPIIIDSYDADIFRTFVMFVHCGSVILDASTVVGLLCCAIEFDIPDLKEACYEFVRKCLSSANQSVVMAETFRYGDHCAALKLRENVQNILIESKTKSSKLRLGPVGRETKV